MARAQVFRERRDAPADRHKPAANPRLRALLLTGTRPDIIKMAPVYQALQHHDVEVALVHSGQHHDTVDALYEFFKITPAVSLTLHRKNALLSHLGSRILDALAPVCESLAPDVILVQGDTTTALMGALAGFYQHIPVGHVEAGLRSGDAGEPFPEEMNRRLIARIARWHFAPTPLAAAFLRKEGIPLKGIYMTGNTVVDAAQWGMQQIAARAIGLPLPASRHLILVTAHRRENWGSGLTDIAKAIRRVLERYPDVEVLWPLHPNPEVAATIESSLGDGQAGFAHRLHLTGPLKYPDMLAVLQRAWLIVTDSGGLQEEAVAARVPVLITRRQTERPEVVNCGAGRLVGTDPDRIVHEIAHLYKNPRAWAAMRPSVSPFGDGRAGERIARFLVRTLKAVRTITARHRPVVATL